MTLVSLASQKQAFKVSLSDATLGAINVNADYFVVVEGQLIFRNKVPGTYPFLVRIFAAGSWRDVENVTEGEVNG